MCKNCGKALSKDDIAIYKKLINRGAEEYMCMDCLAAYLEVPREAILEKIKEYKEMGCTLFS